MLIGGFILGNGGGTKNILIRALGPSLVFRAVDFPLLDPSLQLIDSSGQVVASNNDWMANSNEQAIVDTGLAPTDPRESTLLVALGQGSYTAVVTGIDGTTSNVALVEVYDLDSVNVPQLLNISTRASVGTEDARMIAGVIVGGTTTKAVVIRGLGPSLATVIADPLPNPTLTIVNADAITVAQNDDWQSDLNAGQLQSLNLAPTNTLEAAVLLTAAPGNYTAILSDVNGNSGVGLVEVYNVTN